MSDIKDIAINFEAVKIAMTQDKNGLILKLAIHPSDAPQDLVVAPVGTRYMIAAVMLNDQDEPVKGVKRREADSVISISGALCRNPRFQDWLESSGLAGESSEKAAVEAVREFCGIKSRSEFSTNENARNKFIVMREQFEADYKRGKVK
jgi:hypothetical protein